MTPAAVQRVRIHYRRLPDREQIFDQRVVLARADVIVTVTGLQFGQLMGGAVITETVFTWPGIGSYVVQSVLATDYAPVQAFTLLAAVVYLAANLIVDLVNARLDPRIADA